MDGVFYGPRWAYAPQVYEGARGWGRGGWVQVTAKGAERLAMKRGIQIACREAEMWEAQNNVSVRAYFDDFLRRKAGRVTEKTYRNACTACAHFCDFFGPRANAPLRLVTRKDVKDFVSARREQVRAETARLMGQPMRRAFYAWARSRWKEEGRPQQGLLHPTLLALGDGASREFGALLRAHRIGLVNSFTKGKRKVRLLSLRATCATLLQCSGVSQGLAMELVGHDSEDVHAVYLRPTAQQLRAAAEAMPEL